MIQISLYAFEEEESEGERDSVTYQKSHKGPLRRASESPHSGPLHSTNWTKETLNYSLAFFFSVREPFEGLNIMSFPDIGIKLTHKGL